MPLINCKIHLELSCTKDCVMSTAGNNANKTIFQITRTFACSSCHFTN